MPSWVDDLLDPVKDSSPKPVVRLHKIQLDEAKDGADSIVEKVKHAIGMEHTIASSAAPPMPVILVGLRPAALCVMNELTKLASTFLPMGVVLSLAPDNNMGAIPEVHFDSKQWYETLGGPFEEFNKYCRRERIRTSWVVSEAQRDYMSQNYHSGELYTHSDEPMKSIIRGHLTRSWPEGLIFLVRNGLVDDSLALIKSHSGENCHEPMMVRVLQWAAIKGQERVVKQLLEDRVHPDARLKQGDQTAFQLASAKLNILGGKKNLDKPSAKAAAAMDELDACLMRGDENLAEISDLPSLSGDLKSGLSEVVKHLFHHGAKVHRKPESLPWIRWQGVSPVEANLDLDGDQSWPEISKDSGGLEKMDDDFRAHIVEVYSQTEAHETPHHEFYRVAHPTVEELINGKGPASILGYKVPDLRKNEFTNENYRYFRWIHLPMNHASTPHCLMTWLRDLTNVVCNEKCKASHDPRLAPILRCNEMCHATSGKAEENFPCYPGCGDSIFEAFDWLGQEDVPSTYEDPPTRRLRPQFRRLGLVDGRQTGFALILPYVHFETEENVVRLKKALQDEEASAKVSREAPGGAARDPWQRIICSDEKPEAGEEKIPKTTWNILKQVFKRLPLHCRQTLVQFQYHLSPEDTQQVITRHFKSHWPSEDPLTLMVDQLWMLVLANGTIITAFPSQMGGMQREFPYIYTDIAEELLGNLRAKWRSPNMTVLDLSFAIVRQCIGSIFNQRARYNKRFRFLNMYEQKINDIAAEEVGCFEKLSEAVKRLGGPHDPHYEAKAQECLKELLGQDWGASLMDKMETLKHIRRELNVILDIVKTQEEVTKQMTDELKSGEDTAFRSSETLVRKQRDRASKLLQRKGLLMALDQKAQMAFEDLNFFMRQQEQQVRNLETYFAGKLASQSTRSGKVVLIFTLVTTIFAPLSFITAILALQIRELPHGDGGVDLPLSFVLKWIFGVGFMIALPILFPVIALGLKLSLRKRVQKMLEGRAKPTGEQKKHNSLPGLTRRTTIGDVEKGEERTSLPVLSGHSTSSFTR
ncbi:hypothetical protein B0H67DRAFT_644242 [Lasiosphaeris hirsuta]|uniref:Ankyrin repeat protein n=1 Tax=Lasiosphaeris hirsuta TaxID=260670 RepID=A0AA40AS91_9PEZI|nr:hypothetical protein B0H67DRAFT_644242 [Lasiosphaeris hirsuta]